MIADIPLEPIERASAAELAALQKQKLTALLELAQQRSSFYREHLQGVSLDRPWSLEQLPTMTKQHLIQHSPPESEALLTGHLESAYVFRSGGTTGSPKFSPFSFEEFRRFTAMFLRTYQAAGLRSSDRVANLFACGSLYASFIFVNRMLEELGSVSFPFTGSATFDVLGRHFELFPINTLMGFPSWVLEVVQKLPSEVIPKIEKIFYAGEHLYAEERHFLQETLPNLRLIASGGYGAVDTGIMGYQCQACAGDAHHILADHVLLEIVDPDTLRPVPDGEEGIILVTTLDRFLMPLIRYDIGDVGRILPGNCECGRTMPRFELLGRNEDLRIGIATVCYDEIMRAVAEHPELTSNLQLLKERVGMKDRLIVKVEVRPDFHGDRGALAKSFESAIYRHKPDLDKLVHGEHIHPLRVGLFYLGEIPRVPVTGKVRRIVDLTLE